jgi:Fic family protein
MGRFLAWFESTRPADGSNALNGIARAALVHLWFESIHPFEDGNGRLGRALADMALAQDMHAQDAQASPALVRVFGLAHQMLKTRAAYYDTLNHAQRLRGVTPEVAAIDVTSWVLWFVQAFTRACVASQAVVRDATATRDLADLLAHGLLRVEGVGKATRYAVNVPGWEQPVPKP